MKNKSILLLITCLFISGASILSQTLSEQLKQTVEIVKKKNQYVDLRKFQTSIQNDTGAYELLNVVKPYLSDSNADVRTFALNLVNYTGRVSKSLIIKQAVVQILVNEYKGTERKNAGSAGSYLKNFGIEDFSIIARDSLVAKIKRGVNNMYDLFMLAGYVKLTNAIPYIKAALTNPKINDKTKWAAHLALSRMGDNEETEYCIRVVKSKDMSNSVVYNMLPGLVYTRQKAAFDYLVTVLNSDEKNCMSPNPDNPNQIVCGFRVMEFLAPVIKDFPLETYKGINQIKTKDYNAALDTARNWFKEHKDNYVIIDDTF